MPVHNVHPTGVPNAQPADLLQFRGLLLDAELHVTDSLAQVLISKHVSDYSPGRLLSILALRFAAHGLSDGQIRLISGHSSKRSLEIYQHLESVQKAYQDV
jgi:hypothetical protein